MNHQPFCRGVGVDLDTGVHSKIEPEKCGCRNFWFCVSHKRIGPHKNRTLYPSVHGEKVHCIAAAWKPIEPCRCCCSTCEAARPEEVKAASA